MHHSISEARRYLSNARDLLTEKALKEDGYYQDIKYVRMAGHTAYAGVLVALDSFLGSKKKGRKSVEWYAGKLATLDRRALNIFVALYDTLHLSMGYDGNPSAKIARDGLEDADALVDWIESRMAVTKV